jgi:hypothetical protein
VAEVIYAMLSAAKLRQLPIIDNEVTTNISVLSSNYLHHNDSKDTD